MDEPREDLEAVSTLNLAMNKPAKRSRKKRAVVAGACVGVLLLAGVTVAAFVPTPAADGAEGGDNVVASSSTAKIEQGDLSGVIQVNGTLDYSGQRSIGAGGGVVTATPAPGAVIGLGQSLFAVDNIPVLLLHGTLPAWRAFESGMDDGPDVFQLEQSLAALGYFGWEPDEEFAYSTQQAIEDWQEALGLEQSGRLELGSIVFMPGDVRIASIGSAVGTHAGEGVVTVSSLSKRIDADLKLGDQRLGVVGGKVAVQLPGGGSAVGTIVDVGVPTEKEANGSKSVVVPVGITIDDPATVADLQRASVTVGFPAEQRENVLYVPVEALIALNSKTFGVEIVDAKGKHSKVPVVTGLFADGLVEISGDKIKAGLDVVVPK